METAHSKFAIIPKGIRLFREENSQELMANNGFDQS